MELNMESVWNFIFAMSSLQNFATRRQAQVKDNLERAAEEGEAI